MTPQVLVSWYDSSDALQVVLGCNPGFLGPVRPKQILPVIEHERREADQTGDSPKLKRRNVNCCSLMVFGGRMRSVTSRVLPCWVMRLETKQHES